MVTTSKVILLSAFLLSVVTQLWCAPIPIITIGNQQHADETDSSSSAEIPENDKYNMGHPRVPTSHFFNDLETKATVTNEVSYEPHRGQMFTPNVGSSHWTNDYKLGMRTMNKLFEEGERFDQKINYLIEKKNAYLNGKNSFKVFMIKDIGPDSNLVSNIDTHERLDSEQNVKNITDNGKILTERIFSLPFKSDITKSFDNIGPGNIFHMSQALDNGNKVLKGLLDEIKYGNILSKADPIGVEDPYRDTVLETPIPKRTRTNTVHSNGMKRHSDNFIDINVKDIGNMRESRGQSKFLIDDSDLSQGFGNDEDGGEDSEDADSKASQSGADASSEAGSKIVSAEATKEEENEDDDEDGGEEESEESSEKEEETEKKVAENAKESGEEESDEESEEDEEEEEDEDDPMQMKLGEPELGMGVVDEEGEDNSSDGDDEDDDDDDDNGGGNGNDNCFNGNCKDGFNGNKNEDTGGSDSDDDDDDDDDDDENGNGNGDNGAGEIDDDNGDDEEEDENEQEEDQEDEEEEEGGAMSKSKVRKNATTVNIRLGNNGKHGKKSASAKSTNEEDGKDGEKSHRVHKVRIKAKLNGHNGKAGKSKSKHKKIKVAVKIKNSKGTNGKEAEESEENEEEGEGEEEEESEESSNGGEDNGDDENGDDDNNDDEDDDSDEENGDEGENGDEENGDDENGEEGDNGEDDDSDDEDDDDEEEDEGEDGDNDNGDDKCKTIKIKSGTKLICVSDGDISLPTVSDRDEDDNDNGGEKLSMVDPKKHIEKGKEKKGTWFARKKTKSKAQKKKLLATIKVRHVKKGNKHHISIKPKAPKTKAHGKKHNRKHGVHLNITTKRSKKEDESNEMDEKFSQVDKDLNEIMKPLFMTNITITNSSAGFTNALANDESNESESAESTKKDYSKPQSTKSPSLTSYKIAGDKPPLKITMNISRQIHSSTQEEREGIEKEFNPTEIDSFIKQLKSVYDDDDDFIMFLLKLLKKELKSRFSKN
ncbi:dentin sialophosphoprotein [Octopus bimaculoides]|uniref:Uncharacterized protein n=1 Tax=Octopus bimaculoides TaxID=37653 RepID=A0A0L8G0Z6_OCTBM|nr:dentin sialophosphoprotein [Octopus bimaculoides]XP_014785382.1 dentin sialophosphoprotein [Octopus bimaculoides]|eukprot:XP_014785381.1 PREDICTED: dentin sialophosphoprotein-like [Octopus bimaculoides]